MTQPTSSIANQIVAHLAQTLRASKLFELVTAGPQGAATACPRAAVLLESLATIDDELQPAGRVVATVLVHVRDNDDAGALARLADLCDAAGAALMADASRGGLCADLPVGAATALGPAEAAGGVRRPEAEMTFDVTCHFALPAGPTARVDGRDLFASGPHTLRPGSWERQIERRGLPGLCGEIVLDMGLRGRPITQRGRLGADTAADLQTYLDGLAALIDGNFHEITDRHGAVYNRVLIEHFEPTTPIRHGGRYWCDYTVRYRQQP